MAFTIGHNPDKPEMACILDDSGVYDIELSYVRAHPEWYVYAGCTRVNGILYHTFTLR